MNHSSLTAVVEQDDRFRGNRYSFDGDHLILRNLTLADRMVVQCNATNIHGYLWADVVLNVFKYVSVFCVLYRQYFIPRLRQTSTLVQFRINTEGS